MIFDMKEENLIFVRFDTNDDFFESLYSVVEKYSMNAGVILSGMGMLKDFEIGWFNMEKDQYEKIKIETPHELVALTGNIARKDGKPFAHIHVALAGPDKKLVGGHLFAAKVNITNEIFIYKIDSMKFERVAYGSFNKLEGKYF
ncbi:MAG: PPC domain-containing DNA-binding protein [Athalassotoga sp.]|uniref:PPC domain-containing DNA-binding protein n=1 Tax=Athalassotoga sp. TaxID=2022597 RepID=UPI003D06CFC8